MLLLWDLEILQQDGQEEVEQNEMEEDERGDKEVQRHLTFYSVMISHDCLPIFANKHDKNGRKSVSKRIKIGSWWQSSWILRIDIVIEIESDPVPKKFHSKKRENSHANQ